jgi:hypothetical protein
MQEVIYKEIKKVTGFNNPGSSYSPMFSTIGLCVSPNRNGVSNLWLSYNSATRSIFNELIALPYPLNTRESSIYRLVFGFNKGRLSFWKNDGFVFECEGVDELRMLTSVSSGTADLWKESDSDSEYLILHGYSLNQAPEDPDSVVPFIFGVRAISGSIDTSDGYKIKAGADGKIAIACDFEALKATSKYVRNILMTSPATVDEAALLCRRWLRNNSRSFEYEAKNETEIKAIARAVKGMLFNYSKAQGSLENCVTPFPSRGTKAYTSVWDVFFGNFGYGLLGTNNSKDFIKQIARRSRADGKISGKLCSTYESNDYRLYPLFGRAIIREMNFDFGFGWDVLPALEENNKWWLTARISDCGLIFEEIEKRPVITIAVNAFFLDQLRATAELATMLGLEEKVEKWTEDAARLEENIIKNFYDKENNIFNTVYFNIENATRLDVDNSDEFASFVPLWAGINIGEENAKNMVEKIVIPCETVKPEQTAIKLEILRKYGFSEEYDRVKGDFLNSCAAPGTFDNSLACALYLHLISEDEEV